MRVLMNVNDTRAKPVSLHAIKYKKKSDDSVSHSVSHRHSDSKDSLFVSEFWKFGKKWKWKIAMFLQDVVVIIRAHQRASHVG